MLYALLVVETLKKGGSRISKRMEWKRNSFFQQRDYTTVLGKDTFMMEENPEYKVVVYTDSVGCTSCKLQLHRWMELMHEVDSLAKGRVSFYFIFIRNVRMS